jgi:hypothetical protein
MLVVRGLVLIMIRRDRSVRGIESSRIDVSIHSCGGGHCLRVQSSIKSCPSLCRLLCHRCQIVGVQIPTVGVSHALRSTVGARLKFGVLDRAVMVE